MTIKEIIKSYALKNPDEKGNYIVSFILNKNVGRIWIRITSHGELIEIEPVPYFDKVNWLWPNEGRSFLSDLPGEGEEE